MSMVSGYPQMPHPLVSIVIATHNGADYLQPCLESVFAQDYPNYEVIFVDNASTDGSFDLVSLNYPRVKLIRSDANLGYGGGNNLGVSISEGSLLLFLNHDTYVSKDFLTELVRVLEANPRIGIAQSKIMMARNPELIDSIGAYLTWTGMWFHSNHGEQDPLKDSDLIHVLGTCGTCIIVRRTLFEQLRGFDEDYIVYFDDLDLSWRARLAGSDAVVAPRSTIYHWGSATTGQMPSVFTVFHSFKNRLCSLIKLLSPVDLAIVLPVHLALYLGGTIAYFLRLKPRSAFAILRALTWNLKNIRQTIQKRAAVAEVSERNYRQNYRRWMRPLPIRYFMRTSLGYLSRW